MAISTYDSLKSTLAAWMARDDLSDRLSEFIEFTEADLNKRLFTRRQEGRATSDTTPGADSVSLPDDFGSARNLTITSTDPRTELEFYSAQGLGEAYPSQTKGKPKGWAIIGSDIILRPVPDAAYTLTLNYFKRLTALSDSNPTNWVLTYYPDVYLFGGLAQFALFTRNPALTQVWQAKYEAEIDKLQRAERKGAWPRGKAQMRPVSSTIV